MKTYGSNLQEKEMQPYKGYGITKTWMTDHKGRAMTGTVVYMVIDSEDNAIGNCYLTIAEAHSFIDTL